MATQFEIARSQGYSDEEIFSHLEQSPNYSSKIKTAKDQGYSNEEIHQYLSQQQTKQGGIRGELERKVAAPIAEFGIKAATSIPETAKTLSTLIGKGLNYVADKFGVGLTPEQFEQADKRIRKLMPFGRVPDEKTIQSVLKEVTGGRLEPTTPAERMIKGGAGTLGSVTGFWPASALGTPLRAAGTLAMAATTAGLEESGANPWLALGGGILADIATRSGATLASKIAQTSKKGITKTAGELASKAVRLKPEDIKKTVVEAGERLGIKQGEIPLSGQLKNPAIISLETKLRESSLSGRHLEKQLANVESKTRTAYEDVANKISNRKNLLPSAISSEAIDQLKNIEKKANDTYSILYSQSIKGLPQEAASEAKAGQQIFSELNSKIRQLSQGTGTPAKDTITKRLSRLRDDWMSRFPGGEIPIHELVELKKDLNQIIKYEVKGGVDKLLTPLLHLSRNAVQDFGKKAPTFLFKFNAAEKEFANAAKNFRKNDAVRSLLSTQNPEVIINKMKNVKTYRELKSIFSKTPEGKQAFSDLSRYLLEDIISSKIINKEGKVSWGMASGMLKDPKTREIIQEIIGKESFDKLKDISRFSFGIEEGLRKFANSSGTATKGFDIALILGTIGKGISEIFRGNVIKGGKTMSYILAPRVLARLMSNPEFISAMTDLSVASKGKDPSIFFDAAKRAAKFAIPAIIENNSEE